MMDQSFFNMNDDDSDGQYHFLTSNNMPWAINIRDQWDHPKERVDISDAYPQFPSWVIGKGATDTNWYQNPQTQLIVPADSE
ncbi:hypothetical protein JCM19233_375 [Vibrio astriarenae]|nr:hypothetical protein JCM19233_375 [Vibrio sp. C7]